MKAEHIAPLWSLSFRLVLTHGDLPGDVMEACLGLLPSHSMWPSQRWSSACSVMQFSRSCGQNCFRLSFDTLLEAVRSSCDGVDAAHNRVSLRCTKTNSHTLLPFANRIS